MIPKKCPAYLVTGGRFHDTDFARLELLKLLAEQHHIRTKVGNDYSDLDGIRESRFLVTYTCDMLPTPEQIEALRTFVAEGGKWFALHGTNSILRLTDNGQVCRCPDDEGPEFFELLGTQFKAHPPIEAYRVEISDPDHELTRGLEAFDTVDEQYLNAMRADLKVLMHTCFEGDTPQFPDSPRWHGEQQPVLYLRKFGKGEILYLTLGHCRGHYDLEPLLDYNPIVERCSWNMPVYYELLRRGIRWAMATS